MEVILKRADNKVIKVHKLLAPIAKPFNLTICDGSCRVDDSHTYRRPLTKSTSSKILSRVSLSVAQQLGINHLPNCVPLFIRRDPVAVHLHVRQKSLGRERNEYATVKDLYNADACMCQ